MSGTPSVLETFVEHAPASLAMFDHEMRYLAASKRWLVECGIAGQNVIGRSHYEVFPNLPDRWKDAHRRGLSGETVKSDDTWVAADGKLHNIRWEIQPWMTAAGAIGGIFIFLEDITALNHTEQQFRTLVDNMNEGLATMRVIYDADGQPVDFECINANPEFLRMWGKGNIIGTRASKKMPGFLDAHPELLQIHHRNVTTGSKDHFEEWFSHIGRWFSISSYNSQEDMFVILLSDITERKEAEAQQQRATKLLQKTAALSHVGGWEFDPATGALQWTEEIIHIHDLDIADGIDVQRGLDFYHPDSRPAIERAVKEVVELGRPFDLELQLISAKGVHKWVRTVGEPVMKNGKVVRVVGSLQDITERKRVEEVFRENRLQLGLALRAARSGDFVWNTVTNEVVWSEEGMAIFGVKPEEFRGCYEDWYDRLLPEDAAAAIEDVQRSIQSGELETEYRIRRKDNGEIRWIAARGTVIRDDAGTPVRMVGINMDITERKRMELDLQRTKERAELAVRIAGLGEWEFDPSTGHAIQSLRHAQIFGYDKPQPDWSVERYLSHVLPELRDEIRRQVENYSTKGGYEYQTQIRRLDGEVRWVWVRGYLWRNEHNQPARVFGTTIDITEHKQMESELAESQRALKSVFDNISIGLYRTTPDGRILMVNPAMCRMMGFENESELRQYNLEQEGFEPTYDRDTFRRALEKTGELSGYEAVWRRRDGSRFYVRESAKAVRNAKGVIEYYEGTVEDISARRQAELALGQSEARLRSYLDNAPFAIHVVDPIGTIVDCNPLAHKMLGYTKEEILGISAVELHPKEEQQKGHEVFASLSTQGHVETEMCYVAKNRQRIWAAFSGVRMANGYYLCFLHDVTEMRASQQHVHELEEQFRQAQKMEAIGRLAGGIAHDFNNLLMIIMAHAEQLTVDSSSVVTRAKSISKAANRAAELTGQLLAFSRKQTIQPTNTTLGKVVAGVSDMLTRLVGEDVKVDIRSVSNEWPVQLDRAQFEQAIMNLAVNARDAMPNGGSLTIETMNCTFDDDSMNNPLHLAPGEYVLLRVSDTGTGMTEEVRKRVFEPFFTTKEPGKGTGLGLAMVYGIVKQSGGDIDIYSTLGQGTEFSIYLPRVPEVAPVGGVQPTAQPALSNQKHRKILLVEDEDYLRDVISELLLAGGFEVFQAGSMEQAVALSVQHKESIDLLLTDVVLNGGNGRELVRTLNTMGCNFKVLYMSGYTPDSIVHHGVLESGTNFIQKPFTHAAIIKKLEEMLES